MNGTLRTSRIRLKHSEYFTKPGKMELTFTVPLPKAVLDVTNTSTETVESRELIGPISVSHRIVFQGGLIIF